MKITTKHEALSTCLDYVISAVPSTKINPILSHVLIKAEKDKITIVGTNHEIQITASCVGEVKQPQQHIVPADKLRRILNTLSPDDVVKMNFTEQEVTVSAGHSSFKIMTQKPDSFTPLGETSEMQELEVMSSEELLSAIGKVQYAAAEESHRRHLTCVLLNRNEEKIDFVATDGHRMAVKTMTRRATKGDSQHLIPIKTAQILVKHLAGSGEVKISANDRVICFNTEKFELISNTIQETYPDYQSVIPRNTDKKAVFDCAEMKKSLDRVVALSDSRAIAYMEFTENKLSINGHNSDNDSLADWLNISYDGKKITMVFNVVYLTQFLNACKETLVAINMSSEENGALLQPVEEEQHSLIYIVMPVRT